MCEWELHDESGQQYIDCLDGRFWLSENVDLSVTWNLVKVTMDAAIPIPGPPTRFATELRAKDWVKYLQEKQTKSPSVTSELLD